MQSAYISLTSLSFDTCSRLPAMEDTNTRQMDGTNMSRLKAVVANLRSCQENRAGKMYCFEEPAEFDLEALQVSN